MGNDKILDAVWFTEMGGRLIGIVSVQTKYDGIVFYIGTAIGMDEEEDKVRIMERGARFPFIAGRMMFGMDVDDNK